MSAAPRLYWLPNVADWSARLRSLKVSAECSWRRLVALAGADLDFLQTNRLDALLQQRLSETTDRPVDKLRLAVLHSSTADHLLAAIRVGALRRSMLVETYATEYGTYHQQLLNPESELHRFQPEAVLLALDQRHLLGAPDSGRDHGAAAALVESTAQRLLDIWQLVRERCGALILQQSVLPTFAQLAGNNEHCLAGSQAWLTEQLNHRLRALAAEHGVGLLALDTRVALDGLAAWHDPVLWHRAKQELSPAAAPVFGDLVARLLAAHKGRSGKCLVLDLDNTLWGGVIGDDGMESIVLGQGSARGEAFVAFQEYARELSRRGVILAVCSKNELRNALEPFASHPEMILREKDIAAFVANWQDKPANLRQIAGELAIGLDSLVFVDDNPFERNLVRAELPGVAVPELPEDPALWPRCLADAGYFEAVQFTTEDFARTGQYQANRQRETLRAAATDLVTFLRELDMELRWSPIDTLSLPRIAQLINKTNQFNLTTRRYTEAEVTAILAEPGALGVQLRLLDRFGDNGIIAVVIARPTDAAELLIDTWLMSCRVLGRQVEEATLNLLVRLAAAAGVRRLIGEFRPTAKNKMVADLYSRLGFERLADGTGEAQRWMLALERFTPYTTPMQVTGPPDERRASPREAVADIS